MSQVLYTRCPYCRTAFRTSAQQLSLRSGQVRCGNCRKIFNAGGHLVKLEPSPFLARPEYELDEDYDPMKLRLSLTEWTGGFNAGGRGDGKHVVRAFLK